MDTKMMLTCRADVPEIPNAQELFWCWRKTSGHMREALEGIMMQVASKLEPATATRFRAAYHSGLEELFIPYEWDEMSGFTDAAGNEDCEYREDVPSSWKHLGAEDEYEWVTCNHQQGRAGGKEIAAMLTSLMAEFFRPTSNDVPPTGWAALLMGLVFAFSLWQRVTDALFAENVAALKACLQPGNSPPFAAVVMKFAETWDVVLADWVDPRTGGRQPCKVFASDREAIMDQSACAAWRRDPFVRRWHGNALMYYPMRVLSDRAWASLFGWLDAGTTPLQALKADWLARPLPEP